MKLYPFCIMFSIPVSATGVVLLLASTFLTLVIVPVVYSVFDDAGGKILGAMHSRLKRTPPPAPPAS